MKKKIGSIIGIFTTIGVLGIVALFAGRANSALADNRIKIDPIAPIHNTDQLEGNAQLKSSDSEIGELGENIAEEVRILSQRWHDANKKAGWIHVVSIYQVDNDELEVAPDGSTLDKEIVNDDWYLLDEQGHIKYMVQIQRDIHGDLIQASALRDNTGYNLTFRVRFPMSDEALDFVWDFGFPSEAARLAGSLEKEIVSMEDQTVVLYIAIEEFPSPVDFSEYNEPVHAIISKAYYEPESGKLLCLERVMIMVSGEERNTDSMKLVSWDTGVQPTAEVLAYLDATYDNNFKDPWELSEQEVTQ